MNCSLIACFAFSSLVTTQATAANPVEIYKIVEPATAQTVAVNKMGQPVGSGSAFHVGNGYFIAVAHTLVDKEGLFVLYHGKRYKIVDSIVASDSDTGAFYAPDLKNLPSVPICADSPPPGTQIYTIAWPFAFTLQPLITGGMVSGYDRGEMLFDAVVAPGSSGGLVVTDTLCAAGVIRWTYTYNNAHSFVISGAGTPKDMSGILATITQPVRGAHER